MFHGRFKGSHYEAGYKYGALVKKHGVRFDKCPTFPINKKRISFAKKCIKVIEKYYKEIVDEVRGLAEGNEVSFDFLAALIFTMYCYEVPNKCSCFAYKNNKEIVFGRNSDFLVSIEKLYMNVLYKLDNVYSFNGNTTAFIEMEDGVNEEGLAIGLTFIPVKKVKPGFNVGVLTRYLLEKCKTVKEAIKEIKRLPIASGGTLTMIDKFGDMVVIEMTCDDIFIKREKNNFVFVTNTFVSNKMKKYNIVDFDNWRALERYETMNKAFNTKKTSIKFAKELLSGKYGFMCQYDREKNEDTVWSVIYDVSKSKIYRAEGNPMRKKYIEDKR